MTTASPAIGWDENWEGVSLGSATESLVCKGLYIEAGFSNMTDPANRQLNFVRVGTPSMTGPISANFISFSGHIENPHDGVLVDGSRLNLGSENDIQQQLGVFRHPGQELRLVVPLGQCNDYPVSMNETVKELTGILDAVVLK
ncbi:MAG: hypothetical protein ACOX3E_06835 [Desulfomonilia bacterium]